MADSQSLPVISKCTVFPAHKSNFTRLKLSVVDLPLLSIQYIQKGILFPSPPFPIPELLSRLKTSLSHTLTYFPPLAGRLTTDSDGYLYIACNDAGVDFIHADASDICMIDLLGNGPAVPNVVKSRCFAFDGIASYEGHFRPLLAVQVTELADGVFIGCSVSHGVVDGTSFWHFFNSFAELSRGRRTISRMPDFSRDSFLISSVVPKIPAGGVRVTFATDAPIRERIFSFSRESILKLKTEINGQLMETAPTNPTVEISSFQSICALLWRGITRARKLSPSKMTMFMMAVNCRQRLEPKLDALYFGNAAQIVPTSATAGDTLARDMWWCAEQLNKSVVEHDSASVKKYIENWEGNPACSVGNFDGTMIIIGSSPRFPMYDNDFGWGRPVAVRSGKSNKFDGAISAFPGREGGGSMELEVVLAPETMASLESDPEFMQFVSRC